MDEVSEEARRRARGEEAGEGFRCPQCGAPVRWDPERDALACEHCGARTAVERGAAAISERPLADAAGSGGPRGFGRELRVARCQGCGARVTYEGASTSELCVYCGSAVVLAQEANRNVLGPESLVPLDLCRAAVERSFRDWTRRLWLRPNDLVRATLDGAAGIYVPFWSFDADVRSTWTAQAGTSAAPSARVGPASARLPSRSVRWTPARGERSDRYDDLLVAASRGLPEELVARLGGFDTRALVPYRAEYLAGWRAEEYQLDLEEGWKRAQRSIEERQSARCAGDVPGDTQRDLSVATAISGARWKHVLLPVWSVQYRHRGRVRTVLVNGQSGVVAGAAPYSAIKVALFGASLVAAAAALVAASGAL